MILDGGLGGAKSRVHDMNGRGEMEIVLYYCFLGIVRIMVGFIQDMAICTMPTVRAANLLLEAVIRSEPGRGTCPLELP